MKILVTGCNGLLGQHLVPQLASHHQVIALGRGRQKVFWNTPAHYHDIDITEHMLIRNLVRMHSPDVLIHAAAMTQVDECETDHAKCRAVNVDATENLLEACTGIGCHFIFLSTDFVFDGVRGNYREEDPVNPVNWYGETKVLAEQKVALYPDRWSIARTCLLYGIAQGSRRSNILSWIKSSLEKNERIRVVNDQWRTPTPVNDFAKGIRLIMEQRAAGIFHLSGGEIMTPYHLALAVARHFSLNASLIEEVNASTFSQPAKRPPKTGFVIEKARQILDFSPVTLAEGLAR